ncbi:MAG: hypothetical protein AB2L24_05835 [Mangrovibacterium sp.]
MRTILSLAVMIFFAACSPKVATTIYKSYGPVDNSAQVFLLGLEDAVPEHTELLGEISLAGKGATGTYEGVINKAKTEAQKIGGNAIKIMEHKAPSGKPGHQIRAQILKVADVSVIQQNDQPLGDVDYAIINVYRFNGVGPIINYDLHLGDMVICRVKNNYKTSVQVKKMGMNSLWAKTEAKDEIPVTIEPGREYYVKCSVVMGAFVGRPKLELIDPKIGKIEFASFNAKNQ